MYGNGTDMPQHEYQYFMHETNHQGPVFDLKYDAQFNRIASVGCGTAQVWSFNADRKHTPNDSTSCLSYTLLQGVCAQ